MGFDYLKSDTKRIERKLEELNKRYDDVELQKRSMRSMKDVRKLKQQKPMILRNKFGQISTQMCLNSRRNKQKNINPKKRRNQRRINEFQTIFYLNTN